MLNVFKVDLISLLKMRLVREIGTHSAKLWDGYSSHVSN